MKKSFVTISRAHLADLSDQVLSEIRLWQHASLRPAGRHHSHCHRRSLATANANGTQPPKASSGKSVILIVGRLAQGEPSPATHVSRCVLGTVPYADRRTSFRALAALIVSRNAGLCSPCPAGRNSFRVARDSGAIRTEHIYDMATNRQGDRELRRNERMMGWRIHCCLCMRPLAASGKLRRCRAGG